MCSIVQNSYKYPPQNTCTLEELENFCRERLLLYSLFLKAEKMNLISHTIEWASCIKEMILTNSLKTYMTLLTDHSDNFDTYQARQKDLISHWILSLCYCSSEDLREHFIKWELAWLTLVHEFSNTQNADLFLKDLKLKYCEVTAEEKEMFKENLLTCRSTINNQKFNKEVYYKTNFTNILGLVKQREIFINKEYAYFPESDMIHLIQCVLHSQIKEQLEWNFKMLPNALEDGRIKGLVKSLPRVVTTFISYQDITIILDDLEEIAQNNYPLCMKQIHKQLLLAHHLKHDCRMQYGIFLKNLGLSYEDAMQFFEQEFTKSMPKDIFEKKYAYYFKHYYGKVGSKLDYKPYSCIFIQSMSPTYVQHHGCPFKHSDRDILCKEIANDGLKPQDIADIEDLLSEKCYQQACTRYYCATQKVIRDTLVESPNQYCAEAIVNERSLDDLMGTICDTL